MAVRILIVSVKSDMIPVGLAYISASLKRAGHDVEGIVYGDPTDLSGRIPGNFDFIAMGGLSSQYRQLKAIAGLAREAGLKLIGGGGIVTSEPELMSRALELDYAVIGEGETGVVELLACLEGGGNLRDVAGIGFFEGGEFVLTAEREQDDRLDLLPYPDYEALGYLDHLETVRPSDQYFLDLFDYPREYPIITSRSCPFMCTFCYHPVGDKYRKRSVDSIIEELGAVIPKYRINVVSIYDELFSYDEERVYEFCRKFKALAATFPWEIRWNCQMRVSGLKDDMLDDMRDAGCYAVSYGFESYSPVVLKSMKKGIKPEQIHHAVHATADRGISIQGNFIFGDKAETKGTALETLEFWKDHKETGILLAFIIACPDSAMYRHCIAKGLIKDRLDFIENHLFDIMNMTELPDGEFLGMQALVRKYSMMYTSNAVPLERTPTSLTMKCPHCGGVTEYGNFVVTGSRMNKMMYCRKCRKRFFAVSRMHHVLSRIRGALLTPASYKLQMRIKGFRKKLKRRLLGRAPEARPGS